MPEDWSSHISSSVLHACHVPCSEEASPGVPQRISEIFTATPCSFPFLDKSFKIFNSSSVHPFHCHGYPWAMTRQKQAASTEEF